ncbi:MAG: hypothetical protein WC099_03250 [Candidatus Paceibacterota bacterium]
MTIRFRRKLLAFFIVLFIILGALVVLYSQGYRLDTSSFSLTKIGALYIESYQRPIHIYLNETYYKDKSGLLTKGTLIPSVIPKKYQVSIQKDGFLEYTKNIEIFPSQVVRFFNILLVPKDISYTKHVIASSSNMILDDIMTRGLITHETTQKGNQFTIHTIPTDSTQASSTALLIQKVLTPISKQKFSHYLFYSNNPSELIATSSTGIYRIDTTEPAVTLLSSSTLPYAYTIQDNILTFIDSSLETKSSTSTATVKTKQPKDTNPLASLTRIDIHSGSTTYIPFLTAQRVQSITSLYTKNNFIAFITTDKSLILYDTDKKIETILNQNVTSALFSPDAKKLLYRSGDGKVHIYFIKDELETLDAHAGDDIILSLIHTSGIRTIEWYQDSAHLILMYPEEIRLAEVTRKEPNNQPLIWQGLYLMASYAPDQNNLIFATSPTEVVQIDFATFIQ